MLPSYWLQLLINGLVVGAIYTVIALGLNMVYGILRVLHIAHAGVYAAGAYVGLTTYFFSHNILIAILLAAASSAFIGLLIERAIYLPLLAQPRHVPLIVSIALFTLMEELYANIWGHYPLGFHTEIPLVMFTYADVTATSYQLLILTVIGPLIATLWFIINKTKIGLASRAVAQDSEISKAMGVNTNRVVDFNFILGSALAGVAGVLVGVYYGQIFPYMGDVAAYKALVVIVLGGLGSIAGSIIGAIILGIAEACLIATIGYLLPREAFAFIAMILLLLFRPQGLFGKRE